MSVPVVGIQPAVLRWARESLGYSVEQVAERLKREPAEIEAWEKGTAAPTYSQLEHLAYQLYKRPLAVFFLPKPPSEPALKQEFRTLPEFELDQLSADTRYQLRVAKALQLSLRELNDGANPAERNIFRDLKVSPHADVRNVAPTIRDYLGVSLSEQTSWKSADEALKAWREAVEEVGLFVFKQSFKQKEISGFSLQDDEFPLVYLNNSTAKTRQIFSLFHELCHLLVGENGISKVDDSYVDSLPEKQRRTEQFCNALAAEFLVPSGDFASQIAGVKQATDEIVQLLADRYRVSREAIARRFLDRGKVTRAWYEARAKQWAEEYQTSAPGGTYFNNQATYLGERYMRLVFGKHYQGKLTIDQVADHLGVKTKNVPGLEAAMLRNAVSA